MKEVEIINGPHLHLNWEVYMYETGIRRKEHDAILIEDISHVNALVGPRGGLHEMKIIGKDGETLFTGYRKALYFEIQEALQPLGIEFIEKTESDSAFP